MKRSTYLDSVKDNGDDVSCSDGFPVTGSFIIAAMAELPIIESPAVLSVAKGLL